MSSTAIALPDELNPDHDHVQLVLDPEAFAIVHTLAAAGVITTVSLELGPDTTYREAELLATYWGEQSRCLQWWIGDLLNECEKLYGHEFAQIVASTGLSEGACLRRMRVCRDVPKKRRRPRLPFSVHLLVAGLGARAQERWLKIAEAEGLTALELAGRMKAEGHQQERLPDEDPSDDEPHEPSSVNAKLLEEVALAIMRDARPADDGQHHLIPNEDVARLKAALGLEE